MSSKPVTLMVARRVARGRYHDFTVWLDEGRELAADFPGYLGSGILAPPPGTTSTRSSFAFRTPTPWPAGSIRPLAALGLSVVPGCLMLR